MILFQGTVNGLYGRGTDCEVHVISMNHGSWYAVDGSHRANFTREIFADPKSYSETSHIAEPFYPHQDDWVGPLDVEQLADVDTCCGQFPIESVDDLRDLVED
jgi:hypothetical protein